MVATIPMTPRYDVPTDGNGIILDDFNWTQGNNQAFTAEALVKNNLAFNNGGAGIKVYEVANATIRNNTTFRNNFVLQEFASGTGEIGAQAITGTLNVDNNITVNPQGQNSYALAYQSFGRNGKLLRVLPTEGRPSVELDLRQLRPGVYFVRSLAEDGSGSIRRLVVR